MCFRAAPTERPLLAGQRGKVRVGGGRARQNSSQSSNLLPGRKYTWLPFDLGA